MGWFDVLLVYRYGRGWLPLPACAASGGRDVAPDAICVRIARRPRIDSSWNADFERI